MYIKGLLQNVSNLFVFNLTINLGSPRRRPVKDHVTPRNAGRLANAYVNERVSGYVRRDVHAVTPITCQRRAKNAKYLPTGQDFYLA